MGSKFNDRTQLIEPLEGEMTITEVAKHFDVNRKRIVYFVDKNWIPTRRRKTKYLSSFYVIHESNLPQVQHLLDQRKSKQEIDNEKKGPEGYISIQEGSKKLGMEYNDFRVILKTDAIRNIKQGNRRWVLRDDVELALQMAKENSWTRFKWKKVKEQRLAK